MLSQKVFFVAFLSFMFKFSSFSFVPFGSVFVPMEWEGTWVSVSLCWKKSTQFGKRSSHAIRPRPTNSILSPNLKELVRLTFGLIAYTNVTSFITWTWSVVGRRWRMCIHGLDKLATAAEGQCPLPHGPRLSINQSHTERRTENSVRQSRKVGPEKESWTNVI